MQDTPLPQRLSIAPSPLRVRRGLELTEAIQSQKQPPPGPGNGALPRSSILAFLQHPVSARESAQPASLRESSRCALPYHCCLTTPMLPLVT
jgi:hypothetical protein